MTMKTVPAPSAPGLLPCRPSGSLRRYVGSAFASGPGAASPPIHERNPLPKLWIMSDLHLESVPYPGAFAPARPDFDVLVAAGDIWQADVRRGLDLLARLAGGKPVVFVMGNHEHWKGVLGDDLREAKIIAQDAGVTLLDGEAVTVAGCRFAGATLWTDYELAGELADMQAPTGELIAMADGSAPRPFTVADSAAVHATAKAQLAAIVAADPSPLPLVVVTHHAPHPDCLPLDTRGTWAAGNCASDLSELTDSGRAALWVHGHIHASIDMTRPNGTRILCNPAGPMFSNPRFNETLVVELAGTEGAPGRPALSI